MNFDWMVYRTEIEQVLHLNQAALGWAGDDLNIQPLGQGESNLNLLVRAGGRKVNFRIGFRPHLAGNLRQEFELLAQVPLGLGPAPLLLDTSARLLPHPFAILSYVEGEHTATWTPAHLRAHAEGLARLHAEPHTGWGQLGRLEWGRFSLLDRFDTGLAWWQEHHPELLERPDVAPLIPELRHFFEQADPLFSELRRSALVHGDACAPNILFHEGQARYIDFEWAGIGDPAQDLMMLAWDIDNPPWQIKLTGEALAAYLGAYLAIRPDPILPERRLVWMTQTKFFDSLHFRTRAAATVGEEQARYAATVKRLNESLLAQFRL